MKASVMTREALPLVVRIEEPSGHEGEGQVTVAVHVDFGEEPRIGRQVYGEDQVESFRALFTEPCPVALVATAQADGGLEGNVLALVAPEAAADVAEEPWRASVDTPPAEVERLPVFLGRVVRVPSDRQYPEDFQQETAHMLATLLSAGSVPLVEKILEGLP